MKEKELIDRIKNELYNLFAPSFNLESVNHSLDRLISPSEYDILATIKSPLSESRLNLAIEVKYEPRLSSILYAAKSLKSFTSEKNLIPVIASEFLSVRIRSSLKDAGMNYIDLAGNLFFNLENIYVERIVDKNPFSTVKPLKNIFSPISSRITRALLDDPKYEWSISELSQRTGVSLGQTYNVLNAMLGEDFVFKEEEKWKCSDPTSLLDAWKEYYPTYNTIKKSFYSYNPNTLSSSVRYASKEHNLKYALGLFSGANEVAPYIRDLNKVQFYSTQENIDKWKEALDLTEVPSGGNVEIFIPYDEGVFYGEQLLPPGVRDTPVVSNIQLYLDLFKNPARGEEAADILRREYIRF